MSADAYQNLCTALDGDPHLRAVVYAVLVPGAGRVLFVGLTNPDGERPLESVKLLLDVGESKADSRELAESINQFIVEREAQKERT